MLPGNEYNPNGYFEIARLVDVNDQALDVLGASWRCPPTFEDVEAAASELAPILGAAWDVLQSGFRGIPVLKDPRISLLLPLWGPLFGDDTLYVLCVRDPLAVARSLARRNRMPIEVGLALWETYQIACLRGLAGRTAVVVDVNRLLADPRERVRLVGRVAAGLRLELSNQLHDTVDDKLAAPGAARNELARSLSPEQLSLYDGLMAAGSDGARLLPRPGPGKFDVSLQATQVLAVYRGLIDSERLLNESEECRDSLTSVAGPAAIRRGGTTTGQPSTT